jgi:7-cyano-7-deazaguanine synthase
MGCRDLVTGICQEDNANYPDCTEEFRASFESCANISLGLKQSSGFELHAPLMHLSKAQSVLLAHEMPECWNALAYSHTSYDGKYPPTDMNHSNVLRADGFLRARLPDPLVLRAVAEGLMDLPQSSNYSQLKETK